MNRTPLLLMLLLIGTNSAFAQIPQLDFKFDQNDPLWDHSGSAEERADRFFDKYDTDNDGKVGMADELGQSKKFMAQMYDKDNNGSIERAEFIAVVKEQQEQQRKMEEAEDKRQTQLRKKLYNFKKLDSKKTWSISKDELGKSGGLEKLIALLDTDENGSLSLEELGIQTSFQDNSAISFLKKMDVNDDGQVTKDEWNLAEARFAKYDMNSDGVIDAEEMDTDLEHQEMMANIGNLDSMFGGLGGITIPSMDLNKGGGTRVMTFGTPGGIGQGTIAIQSSSSFSTNNNSINPDPAMKRFDVDEFLKEYDSDSDGSVLLEEYKTLEGRITKFKKIDENKDEVISRKELEVYAKKIN